MFRTSLYSYIRRATTFTVLKDMSFCVVYFCTLFVCSQTFIHTRIDKKKNLKTPELHKTYFNTVLLIAVPKHLWYFTDFTDLFKILLY